ncbi:MAG: hypothetical protein ACN6RH_17985 [Stenotrophomonas rhizophila]|uniref:hypothetical protein n=1 Tax=Stenotrophomonas rhizophila TaxID=216778 RepID=UPI003D0B017C
MTMHDVGQFRVDIEISGNGPFMAVGFLRPYKSMEPLQRVEACGETEDEARNAALELAQTESSKMWLSGRYRHLID